MIVYESRRYRRAETYTDYAKDLCTNYKIDLRRYNLCVAQKRYIEGKSVRKYAEAHSMKRGSVDHLNRKFIAELAAALKARDDADGVCRLRKK